MPEKKRKYLEAKRAERPVREQRERYTAHPPKSFGWLVIFALVVVAGFAFLYRPVAVPSLESFQFFQQPQKQSAETLLVSKLGARFLEFRHPVHGFSARYPAGYLVVSSDIDAEAVKFTAMSQSGIPVIARFIVTNETFGDSEFNALVSTSPSFAKDTNFSITSSQKGTLGGRTAYFVNATEDWAPLGEPLLEYFSVFDCGPYRVMFEGGTPESSKNEQLVFSAMLESFKCPGEQ